MASRNRPIPKKLKHDAIAEALLEIRFDTTTISEVLFGRLADYPAWKGFIQRRLPAYELPAPVREADPTLRFQPVFELKSSEEDRAVRIGGHVLSLHHYQPYVGWPKFKPELEQLITGLFEKADNVTIRRLGLRYINAIKSDVHGVQSIADLDMKFAVADEDISANANLNFTSDVSDGSECTVRVATPDFVQGQLPHSSTCIIDVDVYTKPNFKTKEAAEAKRWIEFAHDQEKIQFFRLLTNSTIDTLEDK